MPTVSRWLIKSSLIYLFIGFVIGALLLTSKAFPVLAPVWTVLTIHIELTIFGWIIQLTMGTAYWILPRYLETGGRGSGTLAMVMAGTLNAGIWLNVLSYLGTIESWGTIAGRSLEMASVILFVILHWNRAVSHRNS